MTGFWGPHSKCRQVLINARANLTLAQSRGRKLLMSEAECVWICESQWRGSEISPSRLPRGLFTGVRSSPGVRLPTGHAADSSCYFPCTFLCERGLENTTRVALPQGPACCQQWATPSPSTPVSCHSLVTFSKFASGLRPVRGEAGRRTFSSFFCLIRLWI